MNIRRPHYLSKNEGSTYPSHYLFLDTETLPDNDSADVINHIFRLGVACHLRLRSDLTIITEKYFRFTSIPEFWGLLDSISYSGTKLYLIAHNLPFDAVSVRLFDYFRNGNWTRVKFVTNMRTNIWSWTKDKRSIVCLDNMNFFNTSLAELGKNLGVTKMTMPSFSDSNDIWFPYCENDVKVMVESWKTWLRFIRDNDLGNFAPTIAGQALNAFRHKFMTERIFIHTNKTAIELERDSYHGGRVECYRIGNLSGKTYYMLDVNSMYPFIMTYCVLPIKLVSVINRLETCELRKLLQSHCVIANVTLDTNKAVYPYVYHGHLCFPVGKFTTTLSTEELRFALTHNHIIKINKSAIYQSGRPFIDYVRYFYNKRREFTECGNTTYSYLCKLLLNSLYGKFGQRLDKWIKVADNVDRNDGVWNEINADTGEYETYRCLNGTVEKKSKTEEGYNSFVALASHITASARMYLYELMTKAGTGNVIYVDSDSLIVNETGKNNLAEYINEHELGKLKIIQQSSNLIIRNVKDYTFGDIIKRKGIRKDAIELNNNVYEQYHFLGLKGMWREGDLTSPRQKRVVKHVSSEYYKGNVLEDGSVVPFSISE